MLRDIAEPLLGWFQENMRPLPWRADREPYHVWISEIMLQQTRIEAVVRYYARFMQALPDVGSLAEVDDDVLMKLWEGLGYYSRARNLKKAARIIMDEHGGVFPNTYEALRSLPGIGEYTAGAIASICFDRPVPAVDGNVLRVVTRLIADREDILLSATKKHIAALLAEAMPPQAGMFNEALMELGELICMPNGAPDCGRCPLRAMCIACRDGLTGEIPVRVTKTKRRREDKTVFLLRSPQGRIAIEKRPDHGLLSRLYQLPNIDGFHTDEELMNLLETWRLEPQGLRKAKEAKHIFTHIDWMMRSFEVQVGREDDRFLWVTQRQLREDYPLPTAFQKLII